MNFALGVDKAATCTSATIARSAYSAGIVFDEISEGDTWKPLPSKGGSVSFATRRQCKNCKCNVHRSSKI